VALEIKSGTTIASDFSKSLSYWRGLVGSEEAPAGLVYRGEQSHRRRGVVVYGWRDV
jgi:hypothetical protein